MSKHGKTRRQVSRRHQPDLFTTWAGYESALETLPQDANLDPVIFDGGWMLFISTPHASRCLRYHLDPLAGVVSEKPWKSNL